jgi:hypothetical protein
VIFVQCVSVANLPWALAGEQKASMNNCFPSRVRTVPAKKMLQHFRMKNLMPFPEEEITQQTFGLNLYNWATSIAFQGHRTTNH